MTDTPPQYNAGPGPAPGKPLYKKPGCFIPAIIGLVLLLFVGGCSVLVGVAASNDDSNTTTPSSSSANGKVVTLDEYNRVQNGMTREEAERIMDAKVTSNTESDIGGTAYSNVMYQGEGFADSVMITYEANKVTSKTQSGLGPG